MNEHLSLLADEIAGGLAVSKRLSVIIDEFEKVELVERGRTRMTAFTAAKLLENYYTCLETIFFRISQTFENSLASDRWHAELLDRMTLKITGQREAVLSADSRRLLDELRRFRHFTRNYFDVEYDWSRIDYMLDVYNRVVPLVLADLVGFVAFVERATRSE